MRTSKRMIWVCVLLLAVCVALLLVPACYNAWARRTLERRMSTAAREPGTDILLGGGPITIDRGRPRACLLVHGFMSSPADFGDLPEALDRAGWDTYVPLLPGHGTDPRRLEGLRADQMIGGIERELLRLHERYPRLVLVGFSIGGSIAVILSGRHLLEGVVLVNPYFASSYLPRHVLPPRTWHRVLSPFLDYAVRGSDVASVNRPEGASRLVCYRVIPTEAFGEVFAIADRARQCGPADVPLLVLVSEGDATASPRATMRFYETADVSRKTLVTFGRSDHVLLLDYDHQDAVGRIIGFLEALEADH